MNMKRIITLGGSSSSRSINKELAQFAGNQMDGFDVVHLDLRDYELPLYSIDHEREYGFSDDLKKLEHEITDADGIILSLAEHNGAYTAAFKNAFDWLSRREAKVWRQKPMLLLSTSPGARGGQSVLEIAKKRFPFNGGNIVASMSFPSFNDNFKNGEVVDGELRVELMEGIETLRKSI
jgi:NAD(P)H-dependent FMN reductase